MNIVMHGFLLIAKRTQKLLLVAVFTLGVLGATTCAVAYAYGIETFSGSLTDSAGQAMTQAGAHPDVTTTIDLSDGTAEAPVLQGNPKDIEVALPPGLVGNPTVTPKCTRAEVAVELCPVSSQVGTLSVGVLESFGSFSFILPQTVPLYNMVAPPGEPAQFSAKVLTIVVNVNTAVRTGGDYGVTANVSNISQSQAVVSTSLTLWGVPADSSHDAERYERVFEEGSTTAFHLEPPAVSAAPRLPLMTAPTSCPGIPNVTSLSTDSWQEPGNLVTASFNHDSNGVALTTTGCENVPFEPTFSAQPASHTAGAPTEFAVVLKVPQNENPDGLAQADLQKAVVTLPRGMAISSSAAGGLGACGSPEIGLGNASSASCPEASRIGSVEIHTPLLEAPLKGSVYQAQQTSNPFGTVLAIYVEAEGDGVTIKLAGRIDTDPVTGQVTATFDNNPQLPFSEFALTFAGGPRAPLVNPTSCGNYSSVAQLTGWNGKAVTDDSSFAITEGCSSGASFAPRFDAGTISNSAGGFSPFTLALSRNDGEQSFGAISVDAPPGLTGVLKDVPLCTGAQAAAGTCSSASQIGHTTVQAGPGSTPVAIPQAGEPQDPVYLTSGYGGAPYGLSIVVPAKAGPFDLGTVVVRAAIAVNPQTAALTITSDPLPTILQGIPLQIRNVNVTIDRPGFTFNPTNCEAHSVDATISSAEGSSAAVSSHFQAANCATLPFKPKLTASTQGKASKAEGAALTVAIAAKGGPQPGGGEANIKKVEVQLPKQLPSRLTTLQKACSEAQFNANPAACPHESNVGTAEASTPVLANPLKGPAYLVSHGGAAFPDLEIALQGEGVTLVLDGKTQITKGVTYSRFQTVPDAPISSFRLSLPTGKFSILTANLPESAKYDLCTQSLQMPTRITGQNGAVIEQKTPIAISGCSTSMSIVSHRVNAKAVTLSVYVPAAGTLKASGKGLRQVTKTSKGRETLSLSLSQQRAGKLSTKLKLRFVPSKGKSQSRSLSAKFKK